MEASEEDEINPGLAERLGRLASSTSPANNGTPASSTSAKSGHSQHSSPDRDGERKKAFKLVTYNDPDDEEQTNDAEPSDEDRSSVPMELESDAEDDKETKENGEHEVQKELERVNILEDLWKEGVKLPPEPEGFCRKKLQGAIPPVRAPTLLLNGQNQCCYGEENERGIQLQQSHPKQEGL